MNNPVIIKSVNLLTEIAKKCTEKGIGYKDMLKKVNSKETEARRMLDGTLLLSDISRTLGFNFFELYTNKAELTEKIKSLESELTALKQTSQQSIIENAIYKDTMEVLKRHVTLPVTIELNKEVTAGAGL